MKKILVIAFLVLILIALYVILGFSETKSKSGNFKHGVGVAAGFVTAYGLSYRYLGDFCTVQITMAPYVEPDEVMISTGLAFLKDLYAGDNSKLFI